MIQEFINRYEENKHKIREQFEAAHPESYQDILHTLLCAIQDEDGRTTPNPERIHQIDDGDYQGTLVFVIGAFGYQPNDYWYVRVWYGSCSGCDTFLSISRYDDGKPNAQQVDDYMMLALHLLQGLKKMSDETV